MATQNINNATAASAITGSDSVFISKNDNTLQKIDYDLLAKAIIEQYTGSTLAGSAQSLQTAINALNSKRLSANILAGNTAEATYTVVAIVFVSRLSAGNTPTVAICDAWGGITYLSQNTNFVVTVSDKKITIKNNASTACTYIAFVS